MYTLVEELADGLCFLDKHQYRENLLVRLGRLDRPVRPMLPGKFRFRRGRRADLSCVLAYFGQVDGSRQALGELANDDIVLKKALQTAVRKEAFLFLPGRAALVKDAILKGHLLGEDFRVGWNGALAPHELVQSLAQVRNLVCGLAPRRRSCRLGDIFR